MARCVSKEASGDEAFLGVAPSHTTCTIYDKVSVLNNASRFLLLTAPWLQAVAALRELCPPHACQGLAMRLLRSAWHLEEECHLGLAYRQDSQCQSRDRHLLGHTPVNIRMDDIELYEENTISGHKANSPP